jgi:hypothetical protein
MPSGVEIADLLFILAAAIVVGAILGNLAAWWVNR